MRVRDAQLVIKQINNEMLAALYRSDAQKFKLASAKKRGEIRRLFSLFSVQSKRSIRL